MRKLDLRSRVALGGLISLVLLIAWSSLRAQQDGDTGGPALAGTYLGRWESPTAGTGELALRVSSEAGEMHADVVVIGSPTGYKGDTLTVKSLKSMGKGVWAVEFNAQHSKLAANGLFRDGGFLGDYSYRVRGRTDRGQWILKKQ